VEEEDEWAKRRKDRSRQCKSLTEWIDTGRTGGDSYTTAQVLVAHVEYMHGIIKDSGLEGERAERLKEL